MKITLLLSFGGGVVAVAQDNKPIYDLASKVELIAANSSVDPMDAVETTRVAFASQFQDAHGQFGGSIGQGTRSTNQRPTSFPSDARVEIQAIPPVDEPLNDKTMPLQADSSGFERPPAGYTMPSFGGSPNGDAGFKEKQSEEQSELIWWPPQVVMPLYDQNKTETTTSDQLLQRALYNSPRIQAISEDPLIRDLQVIEADAEFDPAVFARQLYDDRTDPVGNTLTTGGAEFLKDNIWTGEAGIRKKLRRGGELEIGQKFGFQNSNSRFFVPQDQGTATLAINYSQPLLQRSGEYVNRAQILIAQSAGGVAWDVFSAELQQELERTLASYWQLYFDRSVFLQKKHNVDRGQKILDILTERQDLDSLPSQITRAKAAVESRRTDLANAFRDVRDAETAIRLAVGERDWLGNLTVEMLPMEHPVVSDFDLPLEQIVYTALDNRPEIREAVRRTKIAAVQLDVSANEILPELTLLFGTYVSALDGDSGIFRAWQDQFNHSSPGYSFGLEFEVPHRRRAAKSRWAQSRLQVSKLQHQLDENIQKVIAESQVAYRRVHSGIQTLKAAFASIEAAAADLQQQQKRWETFALIEGDVGDGQSPTTILDQLLDSQERLTAAELVYSRALLDLQVAFVSLNRATGTLLMHESVSYYKTQEGWVPNLQLERFTSPSYVPPPQQPIEQQRIEQQRIEQQRIEQQRIEQQRIEQQRIEQQRIEQQRIEQQRIEQQRIEQQRIEQQRIEQQRIEQQPQQQQSPPIEVYPLDAVDDAPLSGDFRPGSK